ncbi:phosphonate C-P lyase system protein PhnH [Rhizobium miluonense]|uniref:Alpha-D-ribose 1-methylphosphonate 5-triphosphate synthase subunit PhnH n=1 Tax=Rhizobium miluonense TaxID=411945 RepID=A0A1C3UH36_9HYPH|nr:phosphonate C-P lyase system protein PhnH [Rhizobium miluonense]SCB14780.1 alpha-D-ribose 1-methylphosphonate 5-triphosphate synthase subunit PhnH [Rhizobium miluonense]
MAHSLVPTADDTRTNATFEDLMWALSRPGQPRDMSGEGFWGLAESLLDRECSFHCEDDASLSVLLAATGARPTPLTEADYVFAAIDAPAKVKALASLRIGSLAYPDDAATLFVPARFGAGQRLRLSGPGIKDSVTIDIDGVDPAFWQMRAKAIRYPLGWDLYLVDGKRLLGIPRSTKIEVL